MNCKICNALKYCPIGGKSEIVLDSKSGLKIRLERFKSYVEAYICTDGNHAAEVPIDNCPFCGKQFNSCDDETLESVFLEYKLNITRKVLRAAVNDLSDATRFKGNGCQYCGNLNTEVCHSCVRSTDWIWANVNRSDFWQWRGVEEAKRK
ncbi:MAG: hypothetical protein NC215_00330 [Ruminococcus sp.]|nr:hypothetical protein [Ruminococcus sp.]